MPLKCQRPDHGRASQLSRSASSKGFKTASMQIPCKALEEKRLGKTDSCNSTLPLEDTLRTIFLRSVVPAIVCTTYFVAHIITHEEFTCKGNSELSGFASGSHQIQNAGILISHNGKDLQQQHCTSCCRSSQHLCKTTQCDTTKRSANQRKLLNVAKAAGWVNCGISALTAGSCSTWGQRRMVLHLNTLQRLSGSTQLSTKQNCPVAAQARANPLKSSGAALAARMAVGPP